MSKLVDWNQFDDEPNQQSGGLVDWNQFDEAPQTASYQPVEQYQFAEAPRPAVQYSQPAGPAAPARVPSMRERAISVLTHELPKTARAFDANSQIADNTPAIVEARQSKPEEYWQNAGHGAAYGINQLMDASQYFIQLPARVPAALLSMNPDMLFPKGTEPDAIDQVIGRRNLAAKYKEAHPPTLPATYDTAKTLSQMVLPGGLGAKAETYGASMGLGALEGAGQNYALAVADALSEGKFDPLKIAGNTALGAGFGGMAGGLGQLLSRIFPKKGASGAMPPNDGAPPAGPPSPPPGAPPVAAEPRQMTLGEQVPEMLQEPEMNQVLGKFGLAAQKAEPVKQVMPASEELIQQELTQYPNSFKRYGSEAQGRLDPEQWYMPSELPDHGLEQTIEWLDNLIKYSKSPNKKPGFRLPKNSQEQLLAMVDEKMRREQRRVAGVEPDWPESKPFLQGSVEEAVEKTLPESSQLEKMTYDELEELANQELSRADQQILADMQMKRLEQEAAAHEASQAVPIQPEPQVQQAAPQAAPQGAQSELDFSGLFQGSGRHVSDSLIDQVFMPAIEKSGRVPKMEQNSSVGKAIQGFIDQGGNPTRENLRSIVDGEIPQVMQATQAQPGINDLMSKFGLKGKAEASAPVPSETEEIFRQRRTAFGRNKVDEAKDAALFSDEVSQAVSEVAKKKVSLDYKSSVLESYSKRLWAKLEEMGLVKPSDESFMGPGGIKLTRKADDRLPTKVRGRLEQLRFNLAGGVENLTSKQHVAAVAGSKFGRDGDFGAKSFDVPVPDDLNQAFGILEKLHKATNSTKGAQGAYDAAKSQFKPVFEGAQGGLREQDPRALFNARTKVKAPFGEDLDVAVSLDHNGSSLKLDEAGEKLYKQAVDDAEAKYLLDRNRLPSFKFSVDTRRLAKKALAVAGIAYVASPQSAEAATPGGSDDHKKSPWEDYGALARLAIGAALVHKLTPKLAKTLLTKDVVKSNVIFNDTIQRVAMLDEILETDLAAQVWAHLGAIHNGSFGVKVDPELRMQALHQLKQGEVSIKDALSGKAGTVFEGMSVEARRAIVETEKIKQSLKGIVKNQLDNLEEFLPTAENAKSMEHMKDALHDIQDALSPQRIGTGEKWIKGILSRFMDYHFFYNPAFHLTNTSDQFIAGGTRVGFTNLRKANLALTKNSKLGKLMESSNLTGGFEAERINTALDAGKRGIKVNDFKSDKFNADRVALASVYQYAAGKAKAMGFEGTEEEFAEKLFKGELNPEIAVDAYAHMAETLSRTLGVDPLRINSDVFSSDRVGKYLAVFIKQPARVSNLLMHYAAEGNMKYFWMMLGATALAGGKAAIPADAGYAWERIDPGSYFAAASILDKAELLQYATGKTMSPKLQWAIIPLVMSSSDPARANAGKTIQDGFEALTKLSEGELDRKKAYSLLGSALSIFAPRIAGLPSKQLINGLSAADQALLNDSIPVSYYDQFGSRFGQSEDIPREDMGLNPFKQFADNFLPGESSSINRAKMAKREETRREHTPMNLLGSQSGPQYFNREDIKQKDPLNFLFNGGKTNAK